MYEKSGDSLTVDLGRSRTLTVVLALVHGGALVLAAVCPMGVSIRVAVLGLIGVSFYRGLCVHALRNARGAVTAIALDADDGWVLRRRGHDGVWEEGRLVEKSVRPWLAVLAIRTRERRWPVSVVICADAVSPEAFRRLRLRLRL